MIAAAFIGPGTVTTTASAGVEYGYVLLWTLLFSTIACFILQEGAARVTLASGRDLASVIRTQYGRGVRGKLLRSLVAAAIGIGCAAYEAGNILGAVEGISLITPVPKRWIALLISLFAGLLLWFGSGKIIAQIMGLIVAAMALSFCYIAANSSPSIRLVMEGLFIPRIPQRSGILVLGLIGTTVVPYNIFLGSGLARGQNRHDTRFGLMVSIGLGGLISMAIVLVGALIPVNRFSFSGISQVLCAHLGPWGAILFGFGLFAAGFSSAVTAPFAAAITARGLFGDDLNPETWSDRSTRYRWTWGLVLAIGILFGTLGIRPIPVIIAAQALNGLLLPIACGVLFLVLNDPLCLGHENLNGWKQNMAYTVVLAVTLMLGVMQIMRSLQALSSGTLFTPERIPWISALTLVILSIPLTLNLIKKRRTRIHHGRIRS